MDKSKTAQEAKPSDEQEGKAANKVPKKERPSTGLNASELALLQTSFEISEKEVQEWYKEFIRDSPSGEIDLKAYSAIRQKFNPDMDEETCKASFESIDTGNDGKITFNEFLFSLAAEKRAFDLEQRLAVMFDLWEISGNGRLSRKELARIVSAIFDIRGEKDRSGDNSPSKVAKRIIEKLDVNGDEKLDKEEFVDGLKNDDAIRKLLLPDL